MKDKREVYTSDELERLNRLCKEEDWYKDETIVDMQIHIKTLLDKLKKNKNIGTGRIKELYNALVTSYIKIDDLCNEINEIEAEVCWLEYSDQEIQKAKTRGEVY